MALVGPNIPVSPNVICFKLRFNVARKRLGTVWHDNESICIVPERTVLHSERCRGVVCCFVWSWKYVVTFSVTFLLTFVSLQTSYDLMMRSC